MGQIVAKSLTQIYPDLLHDEHTIPIISNKDNIIIEDIINKYHLLDTDLRLICIDLLQEYDTLRMENNTYNNHEKTR